MIKITADKLKIRRQFLDGTIAFEFQVSPANKNQSAELVKFMEEYTEYNITIKKTGQSD